jgi:hypothetical protein
MVESVKPAERQKVVENCGLLEVVPPRCPSHEGRLADSYKEKNTEEC